MLSQGENVKLKRFLLGNLEDDDADRIGAQIIGDRSIDDKISLAAEELIEDFLDGALTDEENELFYQHFLTTPERIELLEETALLKNHAKNQLLKEDTNQTEEKKSEGYFESLKRFLTLNLRPIAAVLIFLALAGVAWRVFIYNPGDLSPLEKEFAALNSKDLNNAPEAANLTSKSLIAGVFRDTSEGSKLTAASLTENVLFRLALSAETPKDALLNLELLRGGQLVFKQTGLRIYQNQSGRELKVILPKSVLTKGSYQIKLSSGSTYGFVVE